MGRPPSTVTKVCDTNLHMHDDDALVMLEADQLRDPVVFQAVRMHRYMDECCRVELSGDMKVRYKTGCSPWNYLPAHEVARRFRP